jgi:hypothetical protein
MIIRFCGRCEIVIHCHPIAEIYLPMIPLNAFHGFIYLQTDAIVL